MIAAFRSHGARAPVDHAPPVSPVYPNFPDKSVYILAGPGEVLDVTNESESLIVRIGLEGRARRRERLVWAGVHSLQIAYR